MPFSRPQSRQPSLEEYFVRADQYERLAATATDPQLKTTLLQFAASLRMTAGQARD